MIVLDCGLVLTDHGDAMERLAEEVGVERAVLAPAYAGHRHAYDEHLTDLEYWALVLGDLGQPCDAARAQRLAGIDLGQWSRLRPATERILTALAELGTPAWLLSNAPASFRGHLEAAGWTDLLAGLVISGEERLVKPGPEIYALLEERAGTTEIRFVDDRRENVETALARGWDAHLWTSDSDTAAWLGL